jgi:hypothetical protein
MSTSRRGRSKRRLAALKKRAEFLEKRIQESPFDLSFDKQELSALRWAIFVLQGISRARSLEGAEELLKSQTSSSQEERKVKENGKP